MNQLHFESAKILSFKLEWGTQRRDSIAGNPTNYTAICNHRGECFVMGDTIEDLPTSDFMLKNKPVKQVYKCVICGNDMGLELKDMSTCDQVCSEECSNKRKSN